MVLLKMGMSLFAQLPMRSGEPSFEHKFVLGRADLPFVLSYLKHALVPDAGYSTDKISSIYYDTPTLDLYQEKRASYYLKTKIRVRWYGQVAADRTDPVNCFLELKFKIGGTRKKERFPLSLSARVLTRKNLDCPELNAVPSMLPTLGYSFEGALVPMVIVQYQRLRFTHVHTGARVALDTHVCCPAVNQQFVPGLPPAYLAMCILEIKGSQRELPDWIKPIRYHMRRDAFSKYASCLEHLLQPTGRRE